MKILAIPSAHRIILGLPPVVVPPRRPILPPKRPTLGRGWTGMDNRQLADDLTDWTQADQEAANIYDTSSVAGGDYSSTAFLNPPTGVAIATGQSSNNATDSLFNSLISSATGQAVQIAKSALGIGSPSTVYRPYSTASTLPKWVIPAAIGAVVLVAVMGGRKRS